MRPTTWPTQGRAWVDPGTRGVLTPVIFWVVLFFVFFDGMIISKMFHVREVNRGTRGVLTLVIFWLDLFFTILGGRYPSQKHVPC